MVEQAPLQAVPCFSWVAIPRSRFLPPMPRRQSLVPLPSRVPVALPSLVPARSFFRPRIVIRVELPLTAALCRFRIYTLPGSTAAINSNAVLEYNDAGTLTQPSLSLITVSREDELRLGTAEDISQEGEGVDGALTAGANHRHQDPLCLSAKPRAIAAPDFAVDHGRTNSLNRLERSKSRAGTNALALIDFKF